MASDDGKETIQVVVVDVRMPFTSMIWFMVKWAIAAIPALLILIVLALVTALFCVRSIGSIGSLQPAWPVGIAQRACGATDSGPETTEIASCMNSYGYYWSGYAWLRR